MAQSYGNWPRSPLNSGNWPSSCPKFRGKASQLPDFPGPRRIGFLNSGNWPKLYPHIPAIGHIIARNSGTWPHLLFIFRKPGPQWPEAPAIGHICPKFRLLDPQPARNSGNWPHNCPRFSELAAVVRNRVIDYRMQRICRRTFSEPMAHARGTVVGTAI